MIDIEDDLRHLLTRQAEHVTAASVTAVVDRDYRPRTHARTSLVVAGVAGPVAVVAALAVASAGDTRGTRPSSPGTAADPAIVATPSAGPGAPAMRLAGFRLSFPATFVVGRPDTNCTGQLHLGTDERSRLVTTSPGSCPLLVTSVRRELPAGVVEDEIPELAADGSRDADQSRALVFFHLAAPDGTFTAVFVPAELPDGSTVYVTLDWGDGLSGASLAELEHGLTVEPDPTCHPTCTATGG